MLYLLAMIRKNHLLPVSGSSRNNTGGIVGYLFL